MSYRHSLVALASVVFCMVRAAAAQTMCVWDPLGAQGDFSSLMQDYALAAQRWNIHFIVKVFTDEPASIQAFKSGQCDLLNMFGIRARAFNSFTGSFDVPGGLDNYAEVRRLITILSGDAARKSMINGEFETVGIIPLGTVFVVVNDRSINSVPTVKGKRVAVMDWDKTQNIFVEEVGAIPVPLNMLDYGKHFAQGDVDAIPVPMVLYKPLELSKGIGEHGGIIHRPILQFTMQFMIHRQRFPADFGQNSRQYMIAQVDHGLGVARNAELAIPQQQWIYVPTQETKYFDQVMNTASTHLEQAGYYDKRMLALIRRIKCAEHSLTASDCPPENINKQQ